MKNSGSKKNLNLWFECDKCKRKLLQTNVKSHENNCNIFKISSYIENSKYFGSKNNLRNNFPDDLEIPRHFQHHYVFVPQDIAAFCNFTMGCYGLFHVNDKKYLKKIWTISNVYGDCVFVPGSDLQLESETSANFQMSKFPSKLHECLEVVMEVVEDSINDHEEKEFLAILKGFLKNSALAVNNQVIINFYNKKFKLHIKEIKGSNKKVDLADKFSEIQLEDEKFFLFNENSRIRLKKQKELEEGESSFSEMKLEDVGGYDSIVQELLKTMDVALGFVEANELFKITRGALIYGVSGSGKSSLCQALSNHYKTVSKIQVESWKLFSKFYGETETNLKKYFDDALEKHPEPCILIIDEISNISSKNDSATSRVSAVLLNLMDNIFNSKRGSRVFVLANSSNLDQIEPNMRRSGRFDLELEIPIPDAEIRAQILRKMLQSFHINFQEQDIKEIAKHTHGFVAADLKNLLSKSMKRDGKLEATGVLENLKSVKPTAIREIMTEKPDVKWSDIGGMKDLKHKLKQIVDWPINHPETFERLGIKPPRGLLMFGPPGCSKTMIAKALATESNLNFISIKGSDLFSMWVGESEKAVSQLFMKARRLSPCIVFFDEIDAIGGERSAESGSSVKERVLAQILTEIDGVNVLKNVIIVAATNRPDLIDPALLRPGRLDRIVYVQLPDFETRLEIFKLKLSKIPVASDVDLEKLAKLTDGYSGAEIDAVCKEAAFKALEESFDILEIQFDHFLFALELVKPRTSRELLQLYENYNK